VTSLLPAQLGSLQLEDLNAVSDLAFSVMTTAQAAALTKLQLTVLVNADLCALRLSSLQALEGVQLGALGPAQWVALSTAQVASLLPRLLADLSQGDLKALTTTQFAALGSAQLQALALQQWSGLEPADLRAVQVNALAAQGPSVIPAPSTLQVQALGPRQIQALEPRDVLVMSTAQITALGTESIQLLSAAQLDAFIIATPIMLDLNGDGIRTRAAADGVNFDLLGTGTTARRGWAKGVDALRVRDRNHDGLINDGTELCGAAALRPDGSRAGHGFAAMALEDSSHDGKTDAGELHSLAEFGIVELDLTARVGTQMDHGNLIGLLSTFTRADGSQQVLADGWFAKDAVPRQNDVAASATLGDLLTATANELLGAGPKPVSTAYVPPVIERPHGQEDELRQMPLI